MIKAVKAGDWRRSADGDVVAGGVALADGEYDLKLVASDPTQSAPLPGGEGVVVLDSTVTPELAVEGLARDLVRVVQQARREADLNVSDRITVLVQGDGLDEALAVHGAFVAGRPSRTPSSSARPPAASPARSATARRSWSGSRRSSFAGRVRPRASRPPS